MLKDDMERSTLDVLKDTAKDSEPESSMTSILVAQRDRLHDKVTHLEELLANERNRQVTVQLEVEKVREDNVKLFEKVKYLQGYGANKATPSTNVVVDTYSEQYETKLDPFRKFNAAENQRGYAKLKLHDRATLSMGRAIMTSPTARMGFFFYLLVLHLLIMLVLYKFAFEQSNIRDADADCAHKFQQHMLEHHGH